MVSTTSEQPICRLQPGFARKTTEKVIAIRIFMSRCQLAFRWSTNRPSSRHPRLKSCLERPRSHQARAPTSTRPRDRRHRRSPLVLLSIVPRNGIQTRPLLLPWLSPHQPPRHRLRPRPSRSRSSANPIQQASSRKSPIASRLLQAPRRPRAHGIVWIEWQDVCCSEQMNIFKQRWMEVKSAMPRE